MKTNSSFYFFTTILMICFHASISAQYSADDWKWRDGWMQVGTILELAGVEQGHKVADVGCHEGYLSMHLAKKVGVNGAVFAVDVRNDRLEKLQANAKKRSYKNITTVLGDYDDPKLPKNTLDVVFVIDTYHEISDYKEVLIHLNNALKPGGKLLLLEKLKKRIKGKSRSEQVSAHSLSLPFVKKELEEAGFKIQTEVDDFGLWEENPDKMMWILVAEKPRS